MRPTSATRAPTSNAGKYFFEEARAHPNFGFTQFIVAHERGPGIPGTEQPTNELEYVRVELPVGLSVNPGAAGRCPLAVFEAERTAAKATAPRSAKAGSPPRPSAWRRSPRPRRHRGPVYNLVPQQGQAARFGLELAGNEVFLEGDIDSGRRLPRGLHDQSPARAALRTRAAGLARQRPDPEEPPGLQRAGGRRHLPHHAEHLPRPGLYRIGERILDPAESRLL